MAPALYLKVLQYFFRLTLKAFLILFLKEASSILVKVTPKDLAPLATPSFKGLTVTKHSKWLSIALVTFVKISTPSTVKLLLNLQSEKSQRFLPEPSCFR